MQENRGGGSDRKTCSLPNGIRTGPVTNDVVANSRDQPNQRAHGTNAGTVTTPHGLSARVARNALTVPVPSTCEAAQPPRPLTKGQLAWQGHRLRISAKGGPVGSQSLGRIIPLTERLWLLMKHPCAMHDTSGMTPRTILCILKRVANQDRIVDQWPRMYASHLCGHGSAQRHLTASAATAARP
jgi:hypothetical protein